MKGTPYQEYKESGWVWFGKVPTKWEVKPLKHVVPGLTVGIVINPSSYYVDEGVPALRSLNISTGKVEMKDLVFISTEANEAQSKSKIFDGDIVLVRTGRTGMAAIVPADLNGANCIDLLIVRKSALALPQLLHYVLNSDAVNTQIEMHSCGAIQSHLNTSTLGELIVPIPPVSEQPKMVEYLDHETAKIDALIAEQRLLIEKLREKRQAEIDEAVTKGVDPHPSFKSSGLDWIGDIPGLWQVMELRRLIKPGTSITYGIVQAGPEFDGGVPYIRTSDMSGEELPLDGYPRTSPEIDKSYARSRVEAGDIVIAIRATVGKPLIVPVELAGANLTQGTAKVSPGALLLNGYLKYALESTASQSRFEALAKGATFKEITLDMLRRFSIPLPPLAEQRMIVEKLDRRVNAIKALISDVERSLALLQEHRSALITAVVTGKIDVRDAVKETA